MKLTVITLEEVAALTPVTQDEAEHIYIFDQFGTQGCLLDCEAWKTRQDVTGRRATTPAEKRQKRKDIKKLGKSSILKQRQTLKNDTRVANSSLKFKRDAFTMKDLNYSVENGCGCCQFFHALLKTLLPTRENLDVDYLVFEWIRYGFLLKVQDKQRTFSFQFFSPSGAKSVIHGLKSAKVLTGDTSTSTSLNLAQSWIKDCEMTHGQCGSGRDVSLPKRCLDLKPTSIPDGSAIQLVETHGSTGTYACLSHCWGKDKLITTTSQTIASHLSGIPLAILPKTFGDAVTLTRNLGLRYLWIDSLCIIQDSREDWQIEFSKMADIYHNSFLTIAAISSPDSRGGCFCPEKLSDACFRIQADGLDTLIAARYCNGEGAVADIQTFMEAFPALTRAWIYQERMLSRRILYCTYREFQFECRQNETCECGSRFMPPHPEPGTPAGKAMMQGKGQYGELEKLYSIKGQYSAKQLCQHWQKTVMQYTKLQITHLSDKLPALSGCAKDIGRITGDEFLAGLWRSSFAEGLLWVVNVPVDQPRAVWRAPSWSWASIDSTMGIDYIYAMRTRDRQDFQDKIQEVKCVPTGVDKTGAVKSAHVWIRASLCPVYLRRVCRRCTTSRSRIPYTIENDQWMSTRSPKITPCPVTPGNGIRGLVLKGAEPSFFPDYKYDDRVDFEFLDRNDGFACRHARVFLLHLYDNQSFATDVITDYFLVLKKVVESSSGSSFERVALITLAFKDWARRDYWFRNEYDLVVEQETALKIV
ncbi:HET domain-containing protein [Fusarium keratoplasticum]|nr:HET domain-containing protein [Fusarium keratoplasticum]